MRYFVWIPFFLLGVLPALSADALVRTGPPPAPEPPARTGREQAPPRASAAPGNAISAIPFPGGILDVSIRTAFVLGEDGALEAIDLQTGDVLWKTHEAQVPILVVGNRLLAQAGVKRNRLRVLTLDLDHKGEVVQESNPVTFPRWVVTGDAAGHTFEARWRLEHTQLILNWQASAWADGQQLPTHREPTTRKVASGTALIDLETGEVETAPPEKLPPPPGATVLPRQLQKQAVRWSRVLDRHLLALVLVEKGGAGKKKDDVRNGFRTETASGVPWGPDQSRPEGTKPTQTPPRPKLPARKFELELRAWDWLTGKPIEPRMVFSGRQPTVIPTLDNEYLLLRDAAPAPDEMTESAMEAKQMWTIYSVRALESVGSLPFAPGTHSPLVLDYRIYYLIAGPVRGALDSTNIRPQTLRGCDTRTKKVVWEHPVAGKPLHPPGL
jgi:hypothetical protein